MKDKLISIKVSHELYEVLQKYAKDTGIDNISTAIRYLAVSALNDLEKQKLNNYKILECGKFITKILKTTENIANLHFADSDEQDESEELCVLKNIIMEARTFVDDPNWKDL